MCVILKWYTVTFYSNNQSKMTFEMEFETLPFNTFIWAKLLVCHKIFAERHTQIGNEVVL